MHATWLASIAAAALCTANLAAAQAPTLHIELKSYAYSPVPIHLRAGQLVTLHFMNSAGKGHDFTAKRFFAASRIISGRVDKGEVELAPHQTAAVTLVPAAGRYKVNCSHIMHKQLGMTTVIVVD